MFSFEQLRLPLIQAPMAGGVNTPKMVAGVANLGGVGSYGFAYSSPDKIATDLQAAREKIHAHSQGVINANFFVFSDVEMPEQSLLESALENLATVSNSDATSMRIPQAPYYPDLYKQLEPVWEARPEIITFHFGIPERSIVQKAHTLGIAVGITATCATEAEQIEAADADFIVAQGIDAGGHRGIFSVDQADEALAVYPLLNVLRKSSALPLVAAGGIMNRDDVRQALDFGASAVQMGSAFLTTHESGASPAHKRYLLSHADRDARITYGFSGRPARAINNQFIERMTDKYVLPFPLQNTLSAAMRAAAVKNDEGEYQSMWAGTHFSECREETIEMLVARVFRT